MTGIIMEGRSDGENRFEMEKKSGLNRMLDLRIFVTELIFMVLRK